MHSRPALLLLLLPLLLPARCSPAEPDCLHFPQLLPAKLKELRTKFEEIKDYFQSRDDELSIQLLSSELLDEFKGTFGCQSVSEMMRFYMEEVLPSAMKTSRQHQQSMGDLGNLLLSLKTTMRRCHRFFTCEKRSKTIRHIKETFSKMNENGIYKAMGEFDIFINYIEEYLLMKRRR
ncbi:PREDICTED: interleukin-10 [Buceros rhinoceros silvestris]|uniref:interleukin-10 n=1 Tax=Buceros rhinoceros silvestris TaxID=175836 RepID=UPI000528B9B7|nr:PREDICTED: interleukin-10 [Buceros rhinoceros silvestris]